VNLCSRGFGQRVCFSFGIFFVRISFFVCIMVLFMCVVLSHVVHDYCSCSENVEISGVRRT